MRVMTASSTRWSGARHELRARAVDTGQCTYTCPYAARAAKYVQVTSQRSVTMHALQAQAYMCDSIGMWAEKQEC